MQTEFYNDLSLDYNALANFLRDLLCLFCSISDAPGGGGYVVLVPALVLLSPLDDNDEDDGSVSGFVPPARRTPSIVLGLSSSWKYSGGRV